MPIYLTGNPKSKAEVRRHIATGVKITLIDKSLVGKVLPEGFTGNIEVCGPQYPEAHRWYGVATVVNGHVTGIR